MFKNSNTNCLRTSVRKSQNVSEYYSNINTAVALGKTHVPIKHKQLAANYVLIKKIFGTCGASIPITNADRAVLSRHGFLPLENTSIEQINRQIEQLKNWSNGGDILLAAYANELFEIIYKGGMPELYKNKNLKRELYFQSYIDTYISRDVREITEIGNLEAFKKFIVSVASRTGEQLNYTALALDAGVTVPTSKAWLSILVSSGLVYLLEPYLSSELKRLTHIPKIIFMDTGLACFLAGWESAKELQLSSNAGHYLETFIISEIIKSYNARGIKPNISYYRDKEKNEIDLILYKNNTLYPFEIKKTASPNKTMIKNFEKLNQSKKNIGTGGIICFYDKLLKLDEKNYIIPISSVINISK